MQNILDALSLSPFPDWVMLNTLIVLSSLLVELSPLGISCIYQSCSCMNIISIILYYHLQYFTFHHKMFILMPMSMYTYTHAHTNTFAFLYYVLHLWSLIYLRHTDLALFLNLKSLSFCFLHPSVSIFCNTILLSFLWQYWVFGGEHFLTSYPKLFCFIPTANIIAMLLSI